jgi:hypothetical protein
MKNKNTALVFSSYGMGTATEELRLKLAENYLSIIIKENQLPNFMLFYAEGVKLVTKGSPVIDAFKEIEDRGVKLIVCKTCLNYYNLIEGVKAGMIGTMMDICEIQTNVDKVITL